MSSLIRPRLTSGRLSLLTSTLRLFIFRAVDPTILRDFRQPICVYRFRFGSLVNIKEIRHYRALTDLPYKRRDATASGQTATETQARSSSNPAADASTSNNNLAYHAQLDSAPRHGAGCTFFPFAVSKTRLFFTTDIKSLKQYRQKQNRFCRIE